MLEYMGHGLVGEELEGGQVDVLLEGVQDLHHFAETRCTQH